MKELTLIFVHLTMIVPLTGCFSSQEQESLKSIVSKSPFNMDRDGRSDELVFRSNMTFDYKKVSDYYLQYESVENGKYERVESYSYTYNGDWGYKGKSKVTIYKLIDLSFIRESDGVIKSFNMYFVEHDGLYYTYSRETAPDRDEIRSGTYGVRWYSMNK